MHILFITPDLGDNSLGRTYCLWQLARSLSWPAKIVSIQGQDVWGPLAGTEFAEMCSRAEPGSDALLGLVNDADLVIAVKPLEWSFGLAMKLCTSLTTPLIIDIDDPDLDARLAIGSPVRMAAKWVVKPSIMRRSRKLKRATGRYPRIVSNPLLHGRYGGTLIPHARDFPQNAHSHTSEVPRIVFVGTSRQHKGVPLLRAAVAKLQPLVTLTVTDHPPADAYPWEEWTGPTSMRRGLELVSKADIVVVPSLRAPWSEGQLPAKLVDAMMSGCAVVVSRIDPMPWAVGTAGMTFRPGHLAELVARLDQLRDPGLRSLMGEAARERARAIFSVESNVPIFKSACISALAHTTIAS